MNWITESSLCISFYLMGWKYFLCCVHMFVSDVSTIYFFVLWFLLTARFGCRFMFYISISQHDLFVNRTFSALVSCIFIFVFVVYTIMNFAWYKTVNKLVCKVPKLTFIEIKLFKYGFSKSPANIFKVERFLSISTYHLPVKWGKNLTYIRRLRKQNKHNETYNTQREINFQNKYNFDSWTPLSNSLCSLDQKINCN